jgi:hypothetical protein
MRKLHLLIVLIALLIFNTTIKAQNNDAVIAKILAISGIVEVEKMQEQAEVAATEWILDNEDSLKSFSLKTLDFNGKKLKDLTTTSVIIYQIQEFNPSGTIFLNGKKRILFGFTSQGWVSQYGINADKVNWFLIDDTEWMKMMIAYVKVSSNEKSELLLKETLTAGVLVNKGVKLKKEIKIPFFTLEDEMYLVSDYSSEMKLIYNERTLGVFLKETKNLVQISRGNLIKIHDYFFENN